MHARSWPYPSVGHLCRLTDDCGVIQHAKFWFPDYATGYCVDDNSRALIVAFHAYRLLGDPVNHELMVRYLAFLFYAQRDDGRFRNFIDYSRAFLEDIGSLDSQGRAIWALGHLATLDEEYLAVPAQEMLHRALPHIVPDTPPHTLAYTILGLSAYGSADTRRDEARRWMRPLADALLAAYQRERHPDWEWFLPVLTYANGRLPQALLHAGTLLEDPGMAETGLRVLDFLNAVCFHEEILVLIGCHGWYPRGGRRAQFDQQPIDAGALIEANLSAYRATHREHYLDRAVRAMDWFYGMNVLRTSVFNPHSGGCHDGLNPYGVNCNQGAESTITYLMAQLQLFAEAPHLFGNAAPASACPVLGVTRNTRP